jgi:hypothetical protein
MGKSDSLLVFMIIPIILSLLEYRGVVNKSYFFNFVNTTKQISANIRPDFIPMLGAVLLMGSIYVRKLTPDNFTIPSKLVFFMVNTWFFASFIKAFFSSKPWNIPLIDISSNSFLVMTIMFSWIGMRSIAGFSWILVILGALSSITDVNNAMGVWGAVYILCAFISLILQGNYESFVSQIKQDLIGSGKRISIDINEAKNTAFEIYDDKVKKTERNDFTNTQFKDTGTKALEPPKWYYADNGQTYGTFAETELATLVKSGILTPETLVYNASDVNFGKEWMSAKNTKLANLF